MASSSSASVLRLARLGLQGLRSQQQAAAAASASMGYARLLSSEAAKPAGPPPPGGDESAKKASNVIQYVLWGGLIGGGAFAYTLFTSDLQQQPALGTAPAKPAAVVKDYGAVRKAIADVLDAPDYDDGSYGPVLVRLAWHSSGTYDKTSGTGGSNGGTIRFEPECAYAANAGLAVARGVLEPIKAKFPWITYADLYTLAGVVAIEEMGGPVVPWSPGRTDEPDGSHCTPDGRLPDASKGAQHIRDIFYRMGFDDREIVALSGAHALGRCHTNRSGYDNPWTNAPTTFSNLYFTELLTNKWTKRKWSGPFQYEDKSKHLMMLPTDMALTSDRKFRKFVELYGKDQDTFFEDFAAAFGKLLALGVPPPATAAA